MVCKIRDIPVYYEMCGEGTPVLCLHGYTLDHRVMSGCLEPVFSGYPGYRRIYPDLPGMGRTPADHVANADDMLAVLTAFIDEVIGSRPFLLAGESYGCYLSIGLLRAMPERIEGLLLICPCLVPGSDRILPEQKLYESDPDFFAGLAPEDMERFLGMATIVSEAVYTDYKEHILPGQLLMDEDFIARYRAQGYAFSFDSELRTLVFDKPGCFLTGRQDHVVGYVDAQGWLPRFPATSYAAVDGAGHFLQIEKKAVFDAFVYDWLERVQAAGTD